MKDYYRILEVHPEASQDVMNTAYRALVRQYHPDLYHTQRKGASKSAIDDKMREINEAYNVLSNPSTRADYDRRYRKEPGAPSAETDLRPRLTRVLLWAIGAYAVLMLLKPFLALPWVKAAALIALLTLVFQLYRKQKQPKP